MSVQSELIVRRKQKIEKAIEQWKHQLIDLTGRNKLLHFRELKKGSLNLKNCLPQFLFPLIRQEKVRLSQLFNKQDTELWNDVQSRVRSIHKKFRESYEEYGIHTLFLVYGLCTWEDKGSTSAPNAPVFLCPLQIKPMGSTGQDFELSLEGDWELNQILVYKIKRDFSFDFRNVEFSSESSELSEVEFHEMFHQLMGDSVEAGISKFHIANQILIGNLFYAKLPMVQDFETGKDLFLKNETVAALAGCELAQSSFFNKKQNYEFKYIDVPPKEDWLILDADASQVETIQAAMQGLSFVIEGPPGTGKSQTISNLIASFLAKKKSVLFVAEKRAAIDAVVKRLQQVDLGGAIFDLHGGIPSKKWIASQLEEKISLFSQGTETHALSHEQQLENTIVRLSQYVHALSETRKPWGCSFWEAQEEACREDSNVFPFELRWRGVDLDVFSKERIIGLEEEIKEYRFRSKEFYTSAWRQLKQPFQMDHVLSLLDWISQRSETLLSISKKLTTMFEKEANTFSKVWEYTGCLSLHDELSKVFLDDIYDNDFDDLLGHLKAGKGSMLARAWSHTFSAPYRHAKRIFMLSWIGDFTPTGQAMWALSEKASHLKSRWQQLRNDQLPHSNEHAVEIISFVKEYFLNLEKFQKSFEDLDLFSLPLAELLRFLEALRYESSVLRGASILYTTEQHLKKYGCDNLVNYAKANPNSEVNFVRAFRSFLAKSISQEILNKDQRLASFQAEVQSNLVLHFQRYDIEHIQKNAKKILRTVAEHAFHQRNKLIRQNHIIEAQIRKKRGHRSLRSLMEDAHDLLTSLAPCWTMSPLMVSQITPPFELFDVVIFDEASQVPPADAIPSIVRGKQVIIAGDSKQLPPTSFFDASDQESGEDEEELENSMVSGYESILDVLGSILPSHRLSWHYRAEDESLIQFSNAYMYSNGLTTFPNPTRKNALDFFHVEQPLGEKTDTRSNTQEIECVIELMLEHARKRPNESLGVITMGIYHADRIENALMRKLQEEENTEIVGFFQEDKQERTFIKSIERVQGDERDVIILSVGYGKNEHGKLLYRFGPINQNGGERRLNVAVTRAKKRMIVVSSILASDFEQNRNYSSGSDFLRRFLLFAEQKVPYEKTSPIPSDSVLNLNSIEKRIAQSLDAMQIPYEKKYGLGKFRVDFALKHNTRDAFVLAVELDGPQYQQMRSIRDRERLRRQILEKMGWHYYRVWTLSWLQNPQKESLRLRDAYFHAIEEFEKELLETETVSIFEEKILPSAKEGTQTSMREPTKKRERKLPYPSIKKGLPIREYFKEELRDLALWILSDDILRTDEDLLKEMMQELGFKRKGSLITRVLEDIIRETNRHL